MVLNNVTKLVLNNVTKFHKILIKTIRLRERTSFKIDFKLKKVLLPPPPLGNFADISYLEENFKPHLLRDVCTLCSGALVSDSLLHMLL